MCVTLAPARLSNTILYAADVGLSSKPIHVLGYQNKPENSVSPVRIVGEKSWGWDTPPTGQKSEKPLSGNAMILPFPAKPGTMSQANVVDTTKTPHILNDIAHAIPEELSRTLGSSKSCGLSSPSLIVFETGIYTVVLASDPRAIPDALSRVPHEKRPAINQQIFDAYAKWYPDWPVALCCFNNREAADAAPMLWWYKPLRPDLLFAPALDCHTGAVPDLHAHVEVDHTVAFGSKFIPPDLGYPVRYRDGVKNQPEVGTFLVNSVIGAVIHRTLPNGDFVCRTQDVLKGLFRPKRLNPPGA